MSRGKLSTCNNVKITELFHFVHIVEMETAICEGRTKMYELVQISPKCWYINSPARIGIYRPSDDEPAVYLVDSGNDKDAGKKIRKILDGQGWVLKGILITHSNADHIGGCHYLQEQSGCKIFAPEMEGAFTASPILEPTMLYGGCPPKDLRHKFLMAQPSKAASLDHREFPQEVEVIPLPGHFLDMVGYRMPDGTVFLADCISSRTTLEKYGIPFLYDVQKYLNTLDYVERMTEEYAGFPAIYVPSHTEVFTDAEALKELIQFNREKILEIGERLLKIAEGGKTTEIIIKEAFESYGLTMNFEQYVLVGSTIRSFLSWMKDGGKLDVVFEENMLIWKAAEV